MSKNCLPPAVSSDSGLYIHTHTYTPRHVCTWVHSGFPCILRSFPHSRGCRILCPPRGSLNGTWGWASAMGDGLPGPSRCALRTPWCSLSVEGDHLPCWKTGVWSRHNGQPGPGRMPSHPSVQTDRPPPLSQTDRHAPLLLSPDRQTDPHPSVQTDRPATPPLSSGRSAPPPTALS